MLFLSVKLANHGKKSIVNGQIGYLLPHFSENVTLNICLDSQKRSHEI